MADESERMSVRYNIDPDHLVTDDKIAFIEELLDTLEYEDLLRIRDRIASIAAEKKEAARQKLEAAMREMAAAQGMSLEEVFNIPRGRGRARAGSATMAGTYRTPDGVEWYGQGRMPRAFRDLLDAGHEIEEFRVRDEA